MKKRIKILCALAVIIVAGSTTTVFSFVEEAASGKYDTVVCTTTAPDGHQTFHSACNSPSKNGPCDKIKNCW